MDGRNVIYYFLQFRSIIFIAATFSRQKKLFGASEGGYSRGIAFSATNSLPKKP